MPRPESGRYPYRFRARTSNTMIGLPRPRRTLLSMPLIRPSDNFLGARPPWTMAFRPSAGSGAAAMRRYRQPRGAQGDFRHECARRQLLPVAALGRFPSWRNLLVLLNGDAWSLSSMAEQSRPCHDGTAEPNARHDPWWGRGGTNPCDVGLDLSGSWQQGHSATYNAPSRI